MNTSNKKPHKKSGFPQPDRKRKSGARANIWGTHAVTEAWLNPDRRIAALFAAPQALASFAPVMEKARAQGLDRPAPSPVEKRDLDRMLEGAVHQGLAIDAVPLEETFVQDLAARAANRGEGALLLMLDQVTDPHNVGAILRSACAFGAQGVIMQRRHSPALTGALAKTACGAVEHVPVACEINLSDALDYLKGEGFTAIGLDERGPEELGAARRKAGHNAKIVLVLGAEGAGLRPKVRDHCDILARLPTRGPIASLNVSNAAAVTLYALAAKE